MKAGTRPPSGPREELLVGPEKPPVRRNVVAGFSILMAGIGGFTAWAATAPLSSAAIAPGSIQVETNRKTVQHLEGGIIAELLVREGDRVHLGQVLLRLDDLESRSLYTLVEGQHLALWAQEARLIAERDELERLVFPSELESKRNRTDVSQILPGQTQIFDSRRATLAGQVHVLRQRVAQLEAQISALEIQLVAGEEQLKLIGEEIADVEQLLRRGLERKPRLLALQRNAAYLEGARGEYDGRIAQAREAIAETELEILNLKASRRDEVATELRDVQTRRMEVEERLSAARAKLVRRDVLAPQAGRVLRLHYFSAGAVIPPGSEILDIVPENDRLVAEARVSPTDIDVVHEGLKARIVLAAYKSRITPQLEAKVVHVSADALMDDRTGAPYYLARLEIDGDQIDRLPGVILYPGMPVETFIVTGERTALDYIIQPLRDSFRRAFRET